jgi:hypothetical protein
MTRDDSGPLPRQEIAARSHDMAHSIDRHRHRQDAQPDVGEPVAIGDIVAAVLAGLRVEDAR